jgi:antitoxin component of MazEF toxin-antitoxin module
MKSQICYKEDGLLIPSDLLKELGSDVSIQKYGNVIIIEPRERLQARNQLKTMLEKLRKAGEALKAPSYDELRELVDQVREDIASHS